jgi:hypothetical protein
MFYSYIIINIIKGFHKMSNLKCITQSWKYYESNKKKYRIEYIYNIYNYIYI